MIKEMKQIFSLVLCFNCYEILAQACFLSAVTPYFRIDNFVGIKRATIYFYLNLFVYCVYCIQKRW